MFPISVSYAMTIHKSQSLSLDCVFADLGKGVFCSGMAYVALSRCKSYSGLYLLNFCPQNVTASTKACIEYSRLQNQSALQSNVPVRAVDSERLWYSTKAVKEAEKSMATEVKEENKKRKNVNKQFDAISNSKEDSHQKKAVKEDGKVSLLQSKKPQKKNCRRKITFDIPSSPKSKKGRVVDKLPGDSSRKGNKSLKRSKNVQQKGRNDKPSQKDNKNDDKPKTQSSSKMQPFSNNQLLETFDWGGVTAPDEDGRRMEIYNPVDADWQRMICTAFGWTFCRGSKHPNAITEYNVHNKRLPKDDYNPEGDGCCFYRTIAHIVTGNEDQYPDIKRSILDFVFHNVLILQEIFEQKQSLLGDLTLNKLQYRDYGDNAAYAYIEYHRFSLEGRQWADMFILEFTAIMLKTPYYSLIELGWYLVTKDHNLDQNEVWKRNGDMTYPSDQPQDLPETTGQCLYVKCVGNWHFRPCHAGLQN